MKYFIAIIIICLIYENSLAQNIKVIENTTLNTDGLYFAEFYDNVFRGHFENVTFKSDDLFFYSIFNQYLRAYGGQCSKHLPKNKVMIMDLECAMENVTTNGYGIESRTCIKWRTVPSGLYAKPDLYNTLIIMESIQKKNALQKGLNFISDPNYMGNSIDFIHKAKGLQKDLLEIFQLNSCSSNSIARFDENLKLFALNKTGIRSKEASKYTQAKRLGGPTGLQNFKKLINDLVTKQSETWAFNRYQPKSINNVMHVGGKDTQGRPKTLKASYSFSNFGNIGKGIVTITFKNGLPECIYFSDFPNNCKAPNAGIIAAYTQGKYRLN